MISFVVTDIRRSIAVLVLGVGTIVSLDVTAQIAFPGNFPWVTGFDIDIPITGQARPALNERFRDDVYGTTIQRITESIAPSFGWNRHEYSRRPAFNSDSARIIMRASGGWWNLYRIEGDNVLFDHQLPSPMEEPNWHPTNPNLYRYFQRSGEELRIYEYNIVSRQSTVIADFNGRLPWPTAKYAWTRYEGRPSRDGRIWCLMAEDESFQAVGLFSYDLLADRILGTLSLNNDDPDHISTSVNGNYCIPSSTGSSGTRAYSLDFGSYTQLTPRSQHSDTALDKNGNDVLVAMDYSTGADSGWLKMIDMATGNSTRLLNTYERSGAAYSQHVSGIATDVPGYIVYSGYAARLDYGQQDADYGDTWGHDRLAIVELAANPTIYNVAYMHNGRGGYWSEPHATVNRDLTRIIFASSWESDSDDDVRSYMVTLGSSSNDGGGNDDDNNDGNNDDGIGSLPRLLTTPDRAGSGDYGWVLTENRTKYWVDGDCRARLQSQGLELDVVPWREISTFADTDAVDCNSSGSDDPGPDDTTNSLPRLLATPDRIGSGNYGWLLTENSTKFWVDADCRDALQQRGLELAVLDWNDIATYPDADPIPCNSVGSDNNDPSDNGSVINDLQIVTTPDRLANNDYGWVLFADGTKHWIDAVCRDRLANNGAEVQAFEWVVIADYSDRDPISCADLVSRLSASH